uniref:APCDDC domain-containing protein n=1 Tax=Macrostomum lignano TaxID=282301 RepID=A0A1I8FA81_9PLAT
AKSAQVLSSFTRRYQFINDTHFSALQFYYSDSSCRDAFYGLETRGYLKVTAMPYTESAAKFLQSKVTSFSAECRRRFQSNPLESDWSPGGGPYHLLLYVEYEAGRKLGFNLHEMQLVRTELGAERRRRLYLGDLATDFSSGTGTGRRVSKNRPDCSNCQLLSRASLRQPPALPWRALMTLSGSPLGEWISVRCESRPQSNYLIRRLRFLPASNSSASSNRWVGEYHHFHDPLCGRPYFSVTAYGWVTAKSRDSLLPATRQFEFRIVGLAITPRDSRSLDQLTAYDGFGCGRRSDWRLNQAQDVTSTNGCDHFRLQAAGGIDNHGVPGATPADQLSVSADSMPRIRNQSVFCFFCFFCFCRSSSAAFCFFQRGMRGRRAAAVAGLAGRSGGTNVFIMMRYFALKAAPSPTVFGNVFATLCLQKKEETRQNAEKKEQSRRLGKIPTRKILSASCVRPPAPARLILLFQAPPLSASL